MFIGRPVVVSIVAVAILAGCRGATGTLPSAAYTAAERSRIALPASAKDLLYVSDVQTNDVYVYSFPQAKLVGTLTGFGEPRSECSDGAGNVFIADVSAYSVIEYSHGGNTPIAALSTPGAPQGCAVNPVTNALAVTSNATGIVLSIFRRTPKGQWRDPFQYGDSAMHASMFCGYDANGNLFLDGLDAAKGFRLDELSRGGTALKNVAVTQTIKAPGQVQWDGTYLAIGDAGVSPAKIYQFTISGSGATKAGTTTLDGTTSVRQSWIEGATVIGPDYGKSVGLWKYPAGGSPAKMLRRVHGYGATISVAAQSR
jgi:hypothetical protein